jgi:hypothetical protein
MTKAMNRRIASSGSLQVRQLKQRADAEPGLSSPGTSSVAPPAMRGLSAGQPGHQLRARINQQKNWFKGSAVLGQHTGIEAA